MIVRVIHAKPAADRQGNSIYPPEGGFIEAKVWDCLFEGLDIFELRDMNWFSRNEDSLENVAFVY